LWTFERLTVFDPSCYHR